MRLLHRLRSALGRFRLAAARLRRPGPGERPGGDGWFLERLGESANLRVIGALRRVLDRGIPTLWVFADGRHRGHLESILPGLTGEPAARDPRLAAGPVLRSLDGADHNFVMPGCRERLAEAFLAWLSSPDRPWSGAVGGSLQTPSIGAHSDSGD